MPPRVHQFSPHVRFWSEMHCVSPFHSCCSVPLRRSLAAFRYGDCHCCQVLTKTAKCQSISVKVARVLSAVLELRHADRHGEDGERFFPAFFATDRRHPQYMTDRQCPSEEREGCSGSPLCKSDRTNISNKCQSMDTSLYTCVVSLKYVTSTRGCLLPFLGDQRAAGVQLVFACLTL